MSTDGSTTGTRTVRPHRDTVATLHEVAAWMSPGDSARSRLEMCADRLDHTECAATIAPTQTALRDLILADWERLDRQRAIMAEPGVPDGPPSRVELAHDAAGPVAAAAAQMAYAAWETRYRPLVDAAYRLLGGEFEDPRIEYEGGDTARAATMAAEARASRSGVSTVVASAYADLLDALVALGRIR